MKRVVVNGKAVLIEPDANGKIPVDRVTAAAGLSPGEQVLDTTTTKARLLHPTDTIDPNTTLATIPPIVEGSGPCAVCEGSGRCQACNGRDPRCFVCGGNGRCPRCGGSGVDPD